MGDLHHQAQVRGDEPVGETRVLGLLELGGETMLLLAGEERMPRYLRHVALERVGAGEIALDGDGELGLRTVARLFLHFFFGLRGKDFRLGGEDLGLERGFRLGLGGFRLGRRSFRLALLARRLLRARCIGALPLARLSTLRGHAVAGGSIPEPTPVLYRHTFRRSGLACDGRRPQAGAFGIQQAPSRE